MAHADRYTLTAREALAILRDPVMVRTIVRDTAHEPVPMARDEAVAWIQDPTALRTFTGPRTANDGYGLYIETGKGAKKRAGFLKTVPGHEEVVAQMRSSVRTRTPRVETSVQPKRRREPAVV